MHRLLKSASTLHGLSRTGHVELPLQTLHPTFCHPLCRRQLRGLKTHQNVNPHGIEFSGKKNRKSTNKIHIVSSNSPVSRLWRYGIGLVAGGIAMRLSYLYFLPSENPPLLDPPKFSSYVVTSKEYISPTSFILTVQPQMPPCTLDPYAEQWKEGIWSVEFKQPQLQIARHYTPLPPVLSPIEKQQGALRFLIRTEKGGEMSNYLAMLAAGDKLELRGPHSSLKLPKHIADVVFLAGGTGIAPAMQAAYTLLENQPAEYFSQPNIHIVWANRRREDCAGGGESLDESDVYSTATAGKLVRELWALQKRHPKNLRIDYLVDEEKTILNQKRVSSLLRRDTQASSSAFRSSIDSKLIIVSGPEGFVNYLAGPKKWWEGKELQGDLDGMLGHLGVRDWKVWKL